jgi:hypothetical protein
VVAAAAGGAPSSSSSSSSEEEGRNRWLRRLPPMLLRTPPTHHHRECRRRCGESSSSSCLSFVVVLVDDGEEEVWKNGRRLLEDRPVKRFVHARVCVGCLDSVLTTVVELFAMFGAAVVVWCFAFVGHCPPPSDTHATSRGAREKGKHQILFETQSLLAKTDITMTSFCLEIRIGCTSCYSSNAGETLHKVTRPRPRQKRKNRSVRFFYFWRSTILFSSSQNKTALWLVLEERCVVRCSCSLTHNSHHMMERSKQTQKTQHDANEEGAAVSLVLQQHACTKNWARHGVRSFVPSLWTSASMRFSSSSSS